jgi:hypothetical protein
VNAVGIERAACNNGHGHDVSYNFNEIAEVGDRNMLLVARHQTPKTQKIIADLSQDGIHP